MSSQYGCEKYMQALTKATRLIETQRKLVSPGSRVNQRAEFLPQKGREKGKLVKHVFHSAGVCHVRPRSVRTAR